MLSKISSDVGFHAVTGLEYPVVSFTEDVRIQREELFHRLAPLADIGTKGRMKGSMDVLTEEDPITERFLNSTYSEFVLDRYGLVEYSFVQFRWHS